jgi:ABC-type tungstate transport system substrate-binding protein
LVARASCAQSLIGVPFGALIALTRFRGREVTIVVLNALMGLPPVVVGLAVFLSLSRSGLFGSWGLLFTPQAMVIAQTILVAPIIAALARQTIEDLWVEYQDELAAMNVGPARRVATLIWDARFSLVTALLAGFGRAAAEVGAIIIVGGNIDGFTRTMTTIWRGNGGRDGTEQSVLLAIRAGGEIQRRGVPVAGSASGRPGACRNCGLGWRNGPTPGHRSPTPCRSRGSRHGVADRPSTPSSEKSCCPLELPRRAATLASGMPSSYIFFPAATSSFGAPPNGLGSRPLKCVASAVSISGLRTRATFNMV